MLCMIYAMSHMHGAGLAHVRVGLGKPRLQCMRMRAWTQHANWRRAWRRAWTDRTDVSAQHFGGLRTSRSVILVLSTPDQSTFGAGGGGGGVGELAPLSTYSMRVARGAPAPGWLEVVRAFVLGQLQETMSDASAS